MKLLNVFLILLLSSCASTKKAADSDPQSLDTDTIEEIAERIQTAMAPQIGEGKNVGVEVGIYFQGKAKFISLGETKKGSHVAPDENTIFELGSLTKTFTGLLLAQEIESKRVAETDTISQFQKKWGGQKHGNINLMELATHRSGLPKIPCNLTVANPTQPYADYTEKNLVDVLMDDQLSKHPDCVIDSHPTVKVNYSNWGFGILGYVLALKEKTSYPDLLRKKIIQPLKLEDTTVVLSRDQIKRAAQGYDENGNPVPMWERKVLYGNGAVRSTATDLLLYAQAYLHPDTTPLSNAIDRAMKLKYENGNKDRIAYAWFVTPGGNIWHNGMTGGYSSFIKIYPAIDLAIFYLSNSAKELKCFVKSAEAIPCSQ